MDKTQSETVVRFLCKRFDCPMPKLSFRGHKRSGRYFQQEMRVHLAKHAELWVVVHEFSHHLNYIINGDYHRNRLFVAGSPLSP